MACYTIISPGLFAIAASIYRSGMRRPAMLLWSLSIYFGWLLFEVMLTSTGVNTRELRAWITPIAVVIATYVLLITVQLSRKR